MALTWGVFSRYHDRIRSDCLTGSRRLGLILIIVCASYLLLLVLGGWLASGTVKSALEERIADTLAAEVEILDLSVNVASGKVHIQNLTIKRDGVDMVIRSLTAWLPSAGRMIFNRDVKRLVVDGASLEMSAAGAANLINRADVDVYIEELVLRNVQLSLSPSLSFPGLGRVTVVIDSARSRGARTTSVISWLTALEQLAGSVELPSGGQASMAYSNRQLTLSGSWFGSKPLSIPIEIPSLDRSLLGTEQLRMIGKALLKTISMHLAKDRLVDTASSWVRGLLD